MKKYLKQLKKKLTGVGNLSNTEYNKNLWDRYAKRWNRNSIPFEDAKLVRENDLFLGDEWGNREDVEWVVENYIKPFITKQSVVAEIGTGGGRVASKVAPLTKEFFCFDISQEMLKKAKLVLNHYPHTHYVLLKNAVFPKEFNNRFDFVYSFDVFVHLDLHTIWAYMQEFARILKKGGRVFIHTTNLKAPDGWKRFSSQDEYKVEGHYFIVPEVIDVLAHRSGLKIIKRSEIDPKNFYLNRDYLVVLEK